MKYDAHAESRELEGCEDDETLEHALFARRAEALEAAPALTGRGSLRAVFAEIDGRRERARRRYATASMLAAAATCMFVALVGARAAGGRAGAEPTFGDASSTATADDELMTSRLGACVTPDTVLRSCASTTAPRATPHLSRELASREWTSAAAPLCEPDVTCSVAGP